MDASRMNHSTTTCGQIDTGISTLWNSAIDGLFDRTQGEHGFPKGQHADLEADSIRVGVVQRYTDGNEKQDICLMLKSRSGRVGEPWPQVFIRMGAEEALALAAILRVAVKESRT